MLVWLKRASPIAVCLCRRVCAPCLQLQATQAKLAAATDGAPEQQATLRAQVAALEASVQRRDAAAAQQRERMAELEAAVAAAEAAAAAKSEGDQEATPGPAFASRESKAVAAKAAQLGDEVEAQEQRTRQLDQAVQGLHGAREVDVAKAAQRVARLRDRVAALERELDAARRRNAELRATRDRLHMAAGSGGVLPHGAAELCRQRDAALAEAARAQQEAQDARRLLALANNAATAAVGGEAELRQRVAELEEQVAAKGETAKDKGGATGTPGPSMWAYVVLVLMMCVFCVILLFIVFLTVETGCFCWDPRLLVPFKPLS